MKRVELPILLTPLGEVELSNALYLRLFRNELVASKIGAAQALKNAAPFCTIISALVHRDHRPTRLRNQAADS
jgi:hypothetical protein